MLNRFFMALQILFAIALIGTYRALSLSGEVTVKNVVILIFVFFSAFLLSLSLNDNLLKSRVLSIQARQTTYGEEDKNHLLFLISERRQRTTRIVVTELLLLGMLSLYYAMTNLVGLSSLVVAFVAHTLFVLGLGLVHLVKDGINRRTIQEMNA